MTASSMFQLDVGRAVSIALTALTLALMVVAGLLLLRLRAEARRDSAARRERTGLARAYAELSAAKAAAEARGSQLAATLAGMSDGVMMLDGDHRLVQWNDRFPETTGVPREMLRVGAAMEDMIAAQARAGEFGVVDVAAEVARRVVNLRQVRRQQVTERTRPNGQVIEVRRNQIPSGGSVTLYTDITARRRAESAQRAADAAAAALIEEKAQLVAMVCHEVATPLEELSDSLRRLAGLLPPGGGDDPRRVVMQRALNAADEMTELMRDILDMAQMDAGRLTLRDTVFDPAALLSGVADSLAGRAAAADRQLVLEVAPGLPERLRGDGGRVRQVLTNFVTNALKFGDPGRVVLSAARLDLGAPMLRLAVADPGPRIPPVQAARLFQPFTRLTGTAGEGAPGTGLGLAICARLARMMGGEVGMVAASGGGNEFWITLPLRIAEAASAASEPLLALPQPGSHPARRRRGRRALVLLVEDMPVNQVVTGTKLRRDGHRVDIAASGAEAVRLAAIRPYDVVFMDLMMPEMSGFAAAARIRQLPGPAGRVAIFALTAANAPGDRARCLAAGMLGMLSKPVDARALAEAIDHGQGFGAAPAPPAPTASPAPSALPPRISSAAPAILPPPAPASGLLLDAARLRDLQRSLPAGVFAELARQCATDMREQMMNLDDALETGAPAGIEAAAHALAGMAGNYGMQAIERRMRRMMQAARAGDVAAARLAAQGGEAELERTERALGLLLQLREG